MTLNQFESTYAADKTVSLPENKWQFIYMQFKGHPWITAGLIVFSAAQAVCEALAAVLVAVILQEIGQGVSLSSMVPDFLNEPIGKLEALETKYRILVVGVSLVFIAIVRLIAIVGASRLSVDFKANTSRKTQDRVHAHLLSAPLSVVDELNTGDVMATVILHSDRVGTLVMAVASFIPRVATIIALAWLLIGISPLTAGIMVTVLAAPVLVTRYLLKYLQKLARLRTELTGNIQQFMVETYGGLRDLRAGVQEPKRHRDFILAMDQHRKVTVNANTVQVSVPNVSESLGLVGIGVILIIAASILSELSPNWLAEVLMGLFLLIRILPAASAISALRSRITDCTTAYEHVRQFLNKSRETKNGDVGDKFTGIGTGIEFSNVSLTYAKGERRALTNVSLTFPSKGLIAVIGASGAGKTSMVQLLMKFHEPASGQIRVGEKNLGDISQNDWRANMGIVPQDPFMFQTTISENIALKKPDASMEEIERAARLAEIHGFIEGLDNGYQTQVGDRGVSLSGGQRQRIAIARALLTSPSLLILDEATSALDASTESQLLDTVSKISKDILVIMVTHRLGPASQADNIIVLDNGRLAAQGTHADLIKPGVCPTYQKLRQSDSLRRENSSENLESA